MWVSIGLFFQTGCATVSPSLPPVSVVTPGSVDSLSEQVGHLRHSVDMMEQMTRENQQERERSLKQLQTLVQQSTGTLLERQRRLQSGLGTFPNQPRGRPADQEPPASQPPGQQADRFAAMHRSAYTSYQRGEFQTAYERYMRIYREAPSDAQKAQALFWAGECAYGMRDWDQAVTTFNAFRREFPADPLVASVLLRTATAYRQKGDSANARRMLETLVRQFPKSEEAGLARQRLAEGPGS